MSIFKEKLDLYKNYVAELEVITGRMIMPEQECEKTAVNYINDEDSKWINIWSKEKELIGFLIISKGQKCHPEADYFIDQLYVLPEYRRQGYAEKIVIDYISRHPGRYCKIILSGNEPAFAFWKDVKKSLGAEELEFLEDCCDLGEHENLYGFRTDL